jgi:hypothetical protein
MIKRIIVFFSVLAFYFVAKEFLTLYFLLENVSPYLAWAMVLASGAFLFFYGVKPLLEIVKMSQFDEPVNDRSKIAELRAKRLESFKENKYLKSEGVRLENLHNTQEEYDRIVNILKEKSREIRSRYVKGVFYKVGVSQNGFIDSIVLLGSSIMMMKEMFAIFNGRVNNWMLLKLLRKVYIAMIISGTEGMEAASDEVLNKLGADVLKKIPFANVVVSSVLDGFVSAALVTRIAIITENYCTTLYVESEKDLYPSTKIVTDTARDIVGGMLNVIRGNLKENFKNGYDKVLKEPISFIWGKASEMAKGAKNVIPFL